jgi:peroxiredoxin
LTKREQEATQILAVSVDPPELSRKLIEKIKTTYPGGADFPFLEDKNHKVIDRYGLRNPEGKGWPYPATYVIDKRGKVRWKFVEVDYRKRPSNEQIRDALRKIS